MLKITKVFILLTLSVCINCSALAIVKTDNVKITGQNMSNTSDITPIIKITNLEQIGMVVPDLTKAMDDMWKNFGIGPWNVLIYTPDRLKEVRYYNKPSKSGGKIGLCQVGKVQFELIEPIGKDNIYYDFVNKYGNGIQHLGWYKVETEEDFYVTVKKLEAAGFPCIWSGHSPRSRFAYFDTTKILNTILEVIWLDKKANVKPDYIYPSEKNGGNL